MKVEKLHNKRQTGYQLLSWSKEVRQKLDLKQWGGSNQPNGTRERYMNPETIKNHMKLLPIYNGFAGQHTLIQN